jgi:hypothetical protein
MAPLREGGSLDFRTNIALPRRHGQAGQLENILMGFGTTQKFHCQPKLSRSKTKAQTNLEYSPQISHVRPVYLQYAVRGYGRYSALPQKRRTVARMISLSCKRNFSFSALRMWASTLRQLECVSPPSLFARRCHAFLSPSSLSANTARHPTNTTTIVSVHWFFVVVFSESFLGRD